MREWGAVTFTSNIEFGKNSAPLGAYTIGGYEGKALTLALRNLKKC